ncbi:hypothetical protein PPERSA_03226 [Pseudocohnilembus persalinus]|uniref:Uncharacterized protein n=1 Tax=Pseudocohnilembus persalinus TaxID=266149 RepID=A0A0V0QE59_PSEPJ|nr:hypothetical protein PPERSA_03226 [Pseudocohnilembus persalinus]|eukprot:KRX00493.1 hypothetical protein PPERSA_03226 [Pseudocohnilembus persalinus]
MAEQSLMQCKKEGHKNQKFILFNMSSENKEKLFTCPICISQNYFKKKETIQKEQTTLLIDELLNEQVKDENIFGWPPIQDEKHSQIYYNHQNYIKEYGLENGTILNFFKIKINEFYGKLLQEIQQEIQNQKKNTTIWLENYYQNQFQNSNTDQELKNIQEIIQKFEIKNFREKFQEFEKKKIDIDQLFDYKQEQNNNTFNNNKVFESLEKQYQQVEKLKQELEKEFTKIKESLDPFKNYQPKINPPQPTQQLQQQQQQSQQQQNKPIKYLKLYKSDYNSDCNKGNFEVNNDQQTIKFKSFYWTYIYSENLQQEKEYHLRFTMDTKNNVGSICLGFSLTSGDQKNANDLEKDHYVRVFDRNNNSYARGGEFKVEGKEKFTEFIKDKQTILNVVFNIEKQFMEIYDDDKISYQRLTFNQNNNNFEEWILGIFYAFGQHRDQEVDIQFID